MKVIGITGGIGSGKSRILYFLKEEYNAYIIEADKLAKSLMMPGNDAYNKIISTFPETVSEEVSDVPSEVESEPEVESSEPVPEDEPEISSEVTEEPATNADAESKDDTSKMIFSAEDNDGKIEIKFRIKPLTLIIIIAAFVVVVSIIILIIIALARKKSGTDNEYKKIKID